MKSGAKKKLSGDKKINFRKGKFRKACSKING